VSADAQRPAAGADAALERLVVAVMAGGSGTRFWPLSRRGRPKQLLDVLHGETLLGATLARVAPLCPPERALVITAAPLVEATRAAAPALPAHHVIGEPTPRNTAPCLALAAIVAQQLRPDALLCLLPADHHIADPGAFRAALVAAVRAASAGELVTLGVVPTHPETGYGYIERGEARPDGAFAVRRFVEKPDAARALAWLQGGRHLWNAGIFVGRADALLRAAFDALPALAEALGPLSAGAGGRFDSDGFAALLARQFAAAPAISIDHGVIEGRDGLVVVPLSAGWSDVGTWRSLPELGHDGDGNFCLGDVLALDCDDAVLVSDGPLVAALGVRGLAVVACGDAVLVAPLARAQEVRRVVEALAARGRSDLL
jgi:mannose-1-phosphate guanylyltransferase